jgi:hypothetical protein
LVQLDGSAFALCPNCVLQYNTAITIISFNILSGTPNGTSGQTIVLLQPLTTNVGALTAANTKPTDLVAGQQADVFSRRYTTPMGMRLSVTQTSTAFYTLQFACDTATTFLGSVTTIASTLPLCSQLKVRLTMNLLNGTVVIDYINVAMPANSTTTVACAKAALRRGLFTPSVVDGYLLGQLDNATSALPFSLSVTEIAVLSNTTLSDSIWANTTAIFTAAPTPVPTTSSTLATTSNAPATSTAMQTSIAALSTGAGGVSTATSLTPAPPLVAATSAVLSSALVPSSSSSSLTVTSMSMLSMSTSATVVAVSSVHTTSMSWIYYLIVGVCARACVYVVLTDVCFIDSYRRCHHYCRRRCCRCAMS